jgi:hypothetical protein
MEANKIFKPDPKLKLMDQVRQVLRYHHYAYRTEKTYCDWILRYIKFHGAKKHPINMGKSEIEAFLSSLAVRGNVSASTQRQALNAIIFLYRDVLDLSFAIHTLIFEICNMGIKNLFYYFWRFCVNKIFF